MMDVVLIGNSHPAIAIGEPDEDGNVRVAVFSHEQYVSKSDLYAVDGGPQPFADKADAGDNPPAYSNVRIEGNTVGTVGTVDDPLANAEPQPTTASGA